MTIFESINNTANSASGIGEKYIKTSRQYFKLKIFQQLTITMSFMTKALIIGALFLVGMIFCAVAAAIAIGNALESMSLGYLIVGFLFIVIALVIYYTRAFINRIIIKAISHKFFDD